MRSIACLVGVVLVGVTALDARAQSSGIAGVVRDSSGAVLPGVTVEASSPVLIEKVRTVTTDTQGRFNIVDLRPGAYTVTFTLVGFTPVRREGIELSAAFTANVNAELRVGSLEETITVTGESPVVDTQNVIRRQVMDDEVIQSMPTSKNWSTLGIMAVGVFSNQNDVGGTAGEHQNQLKAHGGSFNDRIVQLDGLMIANMACNYSCTGLSTNDASTQELSYEFGAISAEVAGGGVRVNIIPREGGNQLSGLAFFNYANDGLQGNNVDDELRSQGITTADSIKNIYDTSFAIGGPIKRDKLWFWSAYRFWGYEQIRTNTFYEGNPNDFVFDPDPSRPGTETQENGSLDLRLTWQISPKNKISGYYNYAPRKTNHWTLGSTIQPDASNLQNLPVNHFETLTFRSTISSRLLFEAAAGNMTEIWTREPVEDSQTSTGYPVTEQTTGINFRAYSATFSRNYTSLRSYRSALSYVTGSHAFKVGMTLQEGPAVTDVYTNLDTGLIVRNGAAIPGDGADDAVYGAGASGGGPGRVRPRHVDDQAAHRQPGRALGLSEQQGRGAERRGWPVDRPPFLRRADQRPELQGHRAAPRGRLRPVRQRQDGAEGDVQPLRADFDGEHRAAAEPLQHHRQQHDPALGRCQPRRHPAGVGARRAGQHQLRPRQRRHPVRPRHHRGIRQAAQPTGRCRRA